MEQQIQLEARNLSKNFGTEQVLQGIHLQVHRGEVVVVLGPSGCGKSTLLRCLNGLEECTEGEIYLDGVPLRPGSREIIAQRQKIGMVFQSYDLFPHKNILDNVTLAPIKVQKRLRKEAEQEAEGLLQRVGLWEKRKARPRELSGGQKQRVAIARIFLKNPPILILDEATSALDSVTEAKIQRAFDNLAQGRTTLIIAHRLSTIRAADRIISIADGVITESGSHAQLIQTGGIYADLYRTQNAQNWA